jgi:hypothetical protein
MSDTEPLAAFSGEFITAREIVESSGFGWDDDEDNDEDVA